MQVLGGEDNQILLDDSDLASISNKLRLVSIDDGEEEKPVAEVANSDEELARMLQVLVLKKRHCVLIFTCIFLPLNFSYHPWNHWFLVDKCGWYVRCC